MLWSFSSCLYQFFWGLGGVFLGILEFPRIKSRIPYRYSPVKLGDDREFRIPRIKIYNS